MVPEVYGAYFCGSGACHVRYLGVLDVVVSKTTLSRAPIVNPSICKMGCDVSLLGSQALSRTGALYCRVMWWGKGASAIRSLVTVETF